ncbi:TPA: hypothetical protein ACYUTG_005330 [Klebsiella pneumoniae]
MAINMIDKILSYASSFGTFISAIAALYAIWLTIFQRRISYRPILIIKDFYTQTSTENFNGFDFEVPEQEGNLPIEINNIGLGTAVSLKYHWEYDVEKGIEQYQSLFKDTFSKGDDSFVLYRKNSGFNFDVGKTTYYYPNRTISYTIDFLLPYNSKSTNTLLDLPPLPIKIIENINFLTIFNNKNYNARINGPTLIVEFQDIEGKIKINKWDTYLEKHYSSITTTGDLECNYALRFTPRPHGWTQRKLQKIRKSYADFINEHDFNKNRGL